MRVFTTFPALSAAAFKSNPWTRNPAVSGARSEMLKGRLAYLALAPRDDAAVHTPNSVFVKTEILATPQPTSARASSFDPFEHLITSMPTIQSFASMKRALLGRNLMMSGP
ncbi:hypothetical protein B0H14DRAFT_3479941 [Mycena olivaceomarginata]|nr:hypothetical protein B0H14DRAFT_3479941 [Mycena olivaceomarginata]